MLREIDSFTDLGLNVNIINVLNDFGYKKPLPIQAECIPHLLAGRDVLGMAHTGSGKTAAFILPLLHNVNFLKNFSQGLIITPTRELAIQIGKVCFSFTKYMKAINVVTLYGGQNYNIELKALKKKPHLIVSTPGRLLDHLNRKTVNLSQLKTLIIDEADEMLRMGFIEDVENIINNIPVKRQTAFFSATLPVDVRQISCRFMNDPKEIYIHSNTNVCADIRQGYWLVRGINKHEALMRFLETEKFDAAIVFVRTKCATLEISEILERFGHNSAALNGDMDQVIRRRTLDQLRYGKLDILIATDVAARGLDIHRISLVINYDVPINADIYIHRIGRTGRAGQPGRSLLFIEYKECRLLRNIERRIKLSIPEVQHPTIQDLLSSRLIKFTKKVQSQLYTNDLNVYRSLLTKIKLNPDVALENLAAVLLKLSQGNRPLVLPPDPIVKKRSMHSIICKKEKDRSRLRVRGNFLYASKLSRSQSKKILDIALYRISVGRNDGVKIKHIIGVLSNKVDLRLHDIGNIRLFSSYSIIELPKALSSNEILFQFSHVRILNKPINMEFLGSDSFLINNSRRLSNRDSSVFNTNKTREIVSYVQSGKKIPH